MTYTVRFTADDAEAAFNDWGANCGPGALAAIMDMTLAEVRPHLAIGGFEKKHYTNPAMMNKALRSIGRPWKKIGAVWPYYGLVRIQWEGPWTEPSAPNSARWRQTHWIGATLGQNGLGIFDINAINNGTGWCSFDDWRNVIVPWLTSSITNANGRWHLTHAIEVNRQFS